MKIIAIIGIILVVVVTVFIIVTTPQMHKRVILGTSQLEMTSNKIKTDPVKTEIKSVQTETTSATVEVKEVDTDAQNKLRLQAIETAAKQETELKSAQQKTVPVKTQVQTQQPAAAAKTAVEPAKTTVKTETKPVSTVTTTKNATVKPDAVQPAPVETTVQTPKPQTPVVKKEIDWEPWRVKIGTTIFSNTSSQLKSTVPINTQYEYSFNVDNNKKISGIQVKIVTSSNRSEAEKGINIIISAIMNLSGKSTLTYPTGTEGVTTAPMKAIITVKEG